jgi:hypothetical protein
MALHFSPVVEPPRDLKIWHANSNEYSFAISLESPTGPGLQGRPGYVASWRAVQNNKPAIKVGGSPFSTFVEAEEACELMLMHLLTAQGAPIGTRVESKGMPAWTRIWHVWWVAVPRRSVTGRLVRGQVMRRHDGRSWIYKKLDRAFASDDAF